MKDCNNQIARILFYNIMRFYCYFKALFPQFCLIYTQFISKECNDNFLFGCVHLQKILNPRIISICVET